MKHLPESPLEETEALDRHFYPSRAGKPAKAKPQHYKIVCISLYNEDIAHLEGLVAELKRRGHTKANKSELIRFALAHCDLEKFRKSY